MSLLFLLFIFGGILMFLDLHFSVLIQEYILSKALDGWGKLNLANTIEHSRSEILAYGFGCRGFKPRSRTSFNILVQGLVLQIETVMCRNSSHQLLSLWGMGRKGFFVSATSSTLKNIIGICQDHFKILKDSAHGNYVLAFPRF